MASDKKSKSKGFARDKEKSTFTIHVKLFTGEKFPLKNITNDMKIQELKMYMEFATGVPVHMQRISYLDDGELLNSTDIRSNDIVPGATLQMRVWPMWKDLIEAVATNDIEWVFRLGVTAQTTYHTPGSDYMTKRARRSWLKERAFLALLLASHRGHEKLVCRLIEEAEVPGDDCEELGADVNGSTPLGRTPLHIAASQGHGNIVDILLEKGADIDAEDNEGETALSIAAKFGHKTCERHLFLFRWQERAKRSRPSAEAPMMAHQYFDSAFPVWKRGGKCQLYFMNILPPGEYEGTRFDSPKKRRDEMMEDEEILDDIDLGSIGRDGKLPAIKEERKQRAKSETTTTAVSSKGRQHSVISSLSTRIMSGPARIGKRRGFSYDDWLGRKKAAEQKIINVKKAEEEKKKTAEDEREQKLNEETETRKRQEAEKSESYETWLLNKETEKKTTLTVPQPIVQPAENVSFDKLSNSDLKQEGYLRTYLRSLDSRRGNSYFCYEEWLDSKEETVLGIHRRKTTLLS